MPIRYYVNLDCEPRRELGEEELLELLAKRERAQSVQARFREEHGLEDTARMRFREKTATPSGQRVTRETTVAEVLEECRPLGMHARHCESCPAALQGTAYSCTQSISIPISAEAEGWLVRQVAPEGSQAFALFRDAVERQGYGKGGRFANWRKGGFLKADRPVTEKRGEFILTSDQVLNALLLVGDIMPPHGLGVLVHLQALRSTEGHTGDELLALMEGVSQSGSAEDAPEIEFALSPEKGEDASITELKFFLYAVYRALSLEVPLALRL